MYSVYDFIINNNTNVVKHLKELGTRLVDGTDDSSTAKC